jgi:hypothetical protein
MRVRSKTESGSSPALGVPSPPEFGKKFAAELELMEQIVDLAPHIEPQQTAASART